MVDHGRDYRPDQADADAPVGDRLNDAMMALLGRPLRPVDVIVNVSSHQAQRSVLPVDGGRSAQGHDPEER